MPTRIRWNALRVDVGWYGVGDDGRWRLFVETDRLAGEVIERALDEARDRLFAPDRLTPTVVESLVAVAQGHLDRIDEPGRRERHRIYHHIELRDGDVSASDRHGLPVDDGTRRHICCDAIVHPLLTENGIPVSVGRSQRIVPDRTRNVVLHRDGGCRVPGCDATHHLEIHHIIHWEDHGPTDTWNLIALCPRHHRLHHRGKLDISGNADVGTVRFLVDGRDLARDGPRPTPPGRPPSTGTYRPPLGETVDPRWIDFTHPSRLIPRPA
ncbi:MAG: HNH endonuclease signature motif containing protein [Actinomycetota bacterium]